MQTLPLKNPVSIRRGICLSVVIFQANIYYKNQYTIKITRSVCLTVWFKISVLAKTQSILSHLAAIIVWKERICAAHCLPTNPQKLITQSRPCSIKRYQKNLQTPHTPLWASDSLLLSFDLLWSSMLFEFLQLYRHLLSLRTHHPPWDFAADCYAIYINWTQYILYTLLIALIYFGS